jgi:hypothetical protein
MATKARPNGHIWMHAEQFHNAAEILWNMGYVDINQIALPLVVNYALSAELALKAAEGITHYGPVIDGIIGAATLESSAHGHDLNRVFAQLRADTQEGIAREFQLTSGEPLHPLLAKCADYFVKARYAYESKGGGAYDLTGIRTLAGGLLKAVMAHGLQRPTGP